MSKNVTISRKIGLKGLSKSTLQLYNYIQGYFNAQKSCFASNTYIANQLSISERTITYAVKELSSRGLVVVVYRWFKGKKRRLLVAPSKVHEAVKEACVVFDEGVSSSTVELGKKLFSKGV